ncbi:hypothetical protein quinque_010786 [Culex quinquefasciatus]
MMLSNMLDLRPALVLTLFTVIDFVSTVKDVRVNVPAAIRRGDSANLICHYDMEGAVLYTVKWYKGKREFFRYTPKENPSMKAFPVLGITVERSKSNGSHLTLTAVEPTMSGKYSCEVSADSPSFHTMVVSGEMEVVDVPVDKPHITGLKPYYRMGELLVGNCSSYNSKPAANLTWFVNSNEVNPKQTVPYPVVRNPDNGLEISTLGLFFKITHHYGNRGKLKLTCVARIYQVYEQSAERLLEDELPNMLASASASPVGLPVNHFHALYDHQFPASSYHHHHHEGGDHPGGAGYPDTVGGGGDFDNQNSDAYMTQLQDMSSSAGSPWTIIGCNSRTTRTRWPLLAQLLLPLLVLSSLLQSVLQPHLLRVASVIMQMACSALLTVAAETARVVFRRPMDTISTFPKSFS